MLLAVVMAVSLLPGTAWAAESLPDWYFLFAIIKNVDADCVDAFGRKTHTTYAMSPGEIELALDNVKRFEAYMNNVGVMRAHVDVVEIDTPVTELVEYTMADGYGSYAGAEQAAPLLKKAGVDLDRYDHVTCIASLAIYTGYLGIGGSLYENGTGHAFINFRNQDTAQQNFASDIPDYPKGTFVHEFLHVMEHMSEKWGAGYNLHGIRDKFYRPTADDYMTCYTDVILNRAAGNFGTGIPSAAWQCPPHVLRTMRELTVPDSVAAIGDYAFYGCGSLESVNISGSVTSIGYAAFWGTSLKNVYYSGTQAQWQAIKMGAFNSALTKAAIHYDSTGPVPVGPEPPSTAEVSFTDVPANTWYSEAVAWAAGKGFVEGDGNGLFLPGKTCTNVEILTFLWRAEEKPESAAAAPIAVASWAQDAVNWAYEKDLIDNTFRPDGDCTRASMAYYIWKVFGSASPGSGSSFTDVPSDADYAEAVAWAVEESIVSGNGNGAFLPGVTCDRGMIATLLYKAYVPEARGNA